MSADTAPETPGLLLDADRLVAISTIKSSHYTKSVPSGKSYYLSYGPAILVWSIPANQHIAKFILGYKGSVWELSRLWAPDGHAPNLLTQTISAGVKLLRSLEPVDLVVSYADPNVGHTGGVYRAASWIYHGQSEESRSYLSPSGEIVARRAFHSGKKCLTKAEIEGKGYKQLKLPGKLRFIKPITRAAKKRFNNEL